MTSLLSEHNTGHYENNLTWKCNSQEWMSRMVISPLHIVHAYITECLTVMNDIRCKYHTKDE